MTSEETFIFLWVWPQVNLEALSKPFKQSHLDSSQPLHSQQVELVPMVSWL